MTNKATRFIQSIADVQFNKTSNISHFKSLKLYSNTFKTALMTHGGGPSRRILLAKRLRQINYGRFFGTYSSSQMIVQQHYLKGKTLTCKEKIRPGNGDTFLYFTLVTLFTYMNVVNYSNAK